MLRRRVANPPAALIDFSLPANYLSTFFSPYVAARGQNRNRNTTGVGCYMGLKGREQRQQGLRLAQIFN